MKNDSAVDMISKTILWVIAAPFIVLAAVLVLTPVLLVVLIIGTTGWTDYYHVSFEDTPSVEVLHYGEPEQADTWLRKIGRNDEVWGAMPMPTEYMLHRDEYTVYIELDMSRDNVYVGGFYLRATTPEGDSLRLRVMNSSRCGGLALSRSPWGRYSCGGGVLRGGRRAIEPAPPCQTLSESSCVVKFVIRDGSVLGEESLPFTVKANGTIVYFDSL